MAKLKKQLKKAVKKKAVSKKSVKVNLTKLTRTSRSLETRAKTTAKNKVKVLEALKDTFGIVTNAIAKVGISNTIFYLWIKNDKEFKKEVEDMQEEFDIIVDDKIKQGILLNDGSMIRFYASCRMKKYRNKIGIGQDEELEPFKMMITVKKTNEQKK